MITLAEHDQCCGCGACVNACSFNALTLIVDKYGFSYPSCIKEKCTNCGACKRACPIINSTPKSRDLNYSAARMINVDSLRKTASGGIATTLALAFYKRGGYVVGSMYDSGVSHCFHHIASSEKEIHKFSGTKYIQSEKNDIYLRVKELLREEKRVLFFGTPCEVAALKSFLHTCNYRKENLLTCDFICHGPISAKIQNEFIKKYEKRFNSKCIIINPKDKEYSKWKDKSLVLKFENGKMIKMPFYDCALGDAFVNMYRPSCSNCHFKIGSMASDITIGDFWGCNQNDKIFSEYGVSIIITHNLNGKRGIEYLRQNNNCIIEDINQDYALSNNPLYFKRAESCYRPQFLDFYDNNGLEFASKKSNGIIRRIKRKLHEKVSNV